MTEATDPATTTELQGQLHNFRKEIDVCIQTAGGYKLTPNTETPDERNKMQRENCISVYQTSRS